jgi:hypothetical protein
MVRAGDRGQRDRVKISSSRFGSGTARPQHPWQAVAQHGEQIGTIGAAVGFEFGLGDAVTALGAEQHHFVAQAEAVAGVANLPVCIATMPDLPKLPSAIGIHLDALGRIEGLSQGRCAPDCP